MRFVYIVLAYLLVPIAFGTVIWRGFRNPDAWRNPGQRFGYGDALQRDSIWVHAVSVGEVQASASLVRALRSRYPQTPIVLTTVTPTGKQLAESLFAGDVQVRYVPYDLPGCVRRFFDRVRPRLAIILETELWPNLYHECGKRGVPLVLASARISPRSVRRYKLLTGLFREALSHGIVIAAQSSSDAQRFSAIGANPRRTHVTGNIKFDFELPASVIPEGRQLRAELAEERPVWIAGSTHAGEEEKLLDAHAELRRTHPEALLLLVPRHRDRFDAVATLLRRRSVSHVTRSSGEKTRRSTEVFLVDTLGELVKFYAAADIAFVGGSLVPIGGHNLLEPAALELPILIGPYNFNSADIARLFLDVGAARLVSGPRDLAADLDALFSDREARERMGAAGKRALSENRGALLRLLDLIDPLLSATAAASASVRR